MHRSTPTTNPIDVDWSQLHRHGAEVARRAHNPEVTRSKRVAGILHFTSFTEAGRQCSRDVKHEHPFTGVAQRIARGAHNSEVRCSNHLAGIITLCTFYRNAWS